jgi:hypothetical protein
MQDNEDQAITDYLRKLDDDINYWLLHTAVFQYHEQPVTRSARNFPSQFLRTVVSALPSSFWVSGISEDNIPQQFGGLEAALPYFRHRVMLLGPPGGGKTTALLKVAQQTARHRLTNPAAPVPLLARLSTWGGSPQQSLIPWLASQIPLLSTAVIDRLLTAKRALLLLDGLDEVRWRRPEKPAPLEGDPRRTLLELIPDELPLVITCRQFEFGQLTNERVTFPVFGALVLEELSGQLRDAALTNHPYIAALAIRDPEVDRLTRNPLMLSLLLTAYDRARGELEDVALIDESTIRDVVIGKYIEQRLRHERNKYGRLQFDLNDVYDLWGPVAMRDAGGGGNVNDFSPDELFRDVPYIADNRAVFLRLSHTLGLIDSRIPGRISFTHLLFRDHFAFRHAKSALFDREPTTRDAAAWALWQIPDRRAVPLLIQALRDPYEYARGSAAGALGMIRDPSAVEELARLLKDRTPVYSIYGRSIAEVAAWAIGQIDTDRACELLKEWNSNK